MMLRSCKGFPNSPLLSVVAMELVRRAIGILGGGGCVDAWLSVDTVLAVSATSDGILSACAATGAFSA
jgi:hypothetical protein